MMRSPLCIACGLVLFGLRAHAVPPANMDLAWKRHMGAGKAAYSRARYAEAQKYFLAALADSKSFNQQDPRRYETSYDIELLFNVVNNLAYAYQARGDNTTAESLYKSSLSLAERALGPGPVAQALDRLADLYRAEGRYNEAEALAKRSLRTSSKIASSPPGTGFMPYQELIERTQPYNGGSVPHLNTLAKTYKSAGKLQQAEVLYERVLSIMEKTFGDCPDLVEPINNLADVCKAERKYAKAESLYKRSLAIMSNTIGFNGPSLSSARDNLAAVYRAEGKTAEAESLYRSR